MNTPTSSLSPADIDALIHTQHEDVFSVLGMHSNSKGNGLVVRALLPGAKKIDVIAKKGNRKVASLDKIHPDGLFEGAMGRRRNRFDYYLDVQYPLATEQKEDPYQFPSVLNDDDCYLFAEGTHEKLYRWMGCHPQQHQGIDGLLFMLWAPSCKNVAVVGEFNHWDGRSHMMRKHHAAGIWELFIPHLGDGLSYKFQITDQQGTQLPLKADPYAYAMEQAPATASLTVAKAAYQWQDQAWQAAQQKGVNHYQQAVSIYEVHAGSWRRKTEYDNCYLSYRELAEELIPYVLDMGFTHLQLMPISEFPFDGSWGYQPIGMYTPTGRFGSADDFRYFVDQCHQHNLSVLVDWVPGHFPTDEHGLGRLDGSCVYEHEDPRKGFHPDWNTLIYNYSRGEVVSFLLSNALFWMDEFHIDGLRVDAVASMLYLDYSREEGEWLANDEGGRENIEAIALLQKVNQRAYFNYPGCMMIAEESTAWPGVSKPVDQGGLGFGYKWNMGWMNDTLQYMSRDPIHRQYHHNEITFGLAYSFSENFILPLSHDEVVHGKGSLLEKMPGDDWQKFANLRAYLGFMWTHPGKKLLFMGCEFAQRQEWNHDHSLDWHLLDQQPHQGVQQLVKDLNHCYKTLPALHQQDCQPEGFEWLQLDNSADSIFAYLRHAADGSGVVLVVCNMTPSRHDHFRLGVATGGFYREVLNSDSACYGGTNAGNNGGINTRDEGWDNYPCHLEICIPPLSTVIFQRQEG
ncbi:MAG: 1,4-alpha-glucan branching enzyme [Oceanicoccus sp.]|jgi:1,4-alpha-glucan branching enzyme